ncbi:MAG: tRNA (N6-threonylcarbamoyladenosine(37)-N6)-methyltransferase TrmO [Clostridia bacterium]|nr:tRNA (N6-threonylcarbamoyladenosine(37)-N6)-methyltransferase TrmO [Clostridia bacterium]
MSEEFRIKPVAKIINGYKEKFGVPRQSGLAESVESRIVFEPEFRDENMLRGIEQYSHLWLIWGFSENTEKWSPTVRPPKLGGNERIGVFATRSPFRPNSLGLSCVEVLRVEKTSQGKELVVGGADLVNGTPVFDIKPYLPYVDSKPGAQGGFSDEHKNDILSVEFLESVKGVLSEKDAEELTEILSLDPRPQYQNDSERIYGMDYKNFRVKFRCAEEKITVVEIQKEKIDDRN